ncbi:unnamed protein product [Blepharisma stoltei]|uniref:ADP-ribosylation factor n=1 Tax=Blepharisma stoltei TaxID=1481888 RepID=A0AAU9JI60_9CILI|nr:unnamed protein product [Blepharisma stoltei]
MGICSSQSTLPQILLLGLDNAGKTTFLYADKWDQFDPTVGFNYEEIHLRQIVHVGVWDVSGKSTLRCLWPLYYRNINFVAIVFVIDAEKEERFAEARRELQILINEEELRETAFLILFNSRFEPIFDLEELTARVGLDLFHKTIKWKAALVDLMEESEDFKLALKWLGEQITN